MMRVLGIDPGSRITGYGCVVGRHDESSRYTVSLTGPASVPLNPIGHQGLYHDDEFGIADLIYNRARMRHVELGRFTQRDPLGYVDGMSVYANYAGMQGGVDPSGSVVIFVHGIKNYNVKEIDHVYSELKSYWHGDDQSLVHFQYSRNDKATQGLTAVEGRLSGVNKGAGKQLASLINHLQSERERISGQYDQGMNMCEPIYVLAYSNGANVAYHAIATYGAKVDGLLMVGASLADNADLNPVINNVGKLSNYWSDYDIATDLPVIDGYGSDGLDGEFYGNPKVSDVEVPYVHHSVSAGEDLNPGLDASNTQRVPAGPRYNPYGNVVIPDATAWLTRYMARNYYAQRMAWQGNLMLSKHGTLPNGIQLVPGGNSGQIIVIIGGRVLLSQ